MVADQSGTPEPDSGKKAASMANPQPDAKVEYLASVWTQLSRMSARVLSEVKNAMKRLHRADAGQLVVTPSLAPLHLLLEESAFELYSFEVQGNMACESDHDDIRRHEHVLNIGIRCLELIHKAFATTNQLIEEQRLMKLWLCLLLYEIDTFCPKIDKPYMADVEGAAFLDDLRCAIRM